MKAQDISIPQKGWKHELDLRSLFFRIVIYVCTSNKSTRQQYSKERLGNSGLCMTFLERN